MKRLKAALLFIAVVAAVSLVACSSGGSGQPEGQDADQATSAQESASAEAVSPENPIIITDMMGREVVIDEPVERVVALTASDCEILYAIGAGDLLVGRGEYCDYPAEVQDVAVVQSGANTNVEQIMALDPQVLIMSDMAQTTEQVEALEDAGVKVVVSEATDIEGVYTAISMIGTLTGREEAAADVVQGMKDTFSEIQEKSTGDGTETVYFEVSPLEYGLWAAGSDTFMNEIAQMLGVRNAFDDVEGWVEVSEEQIIERNPDYIVSITMYYGEGPTPEEEIASRTGWEDITAVKNGAILNLRNNELSRPAPRLAEGAQEMYDFIYGE
jgi:iron complex transport system substrate-binding protein